MTDELIQQFVYEWAGFDFLPDGIYLIDFGVHQKVIDDSEYDEHWTRYSSND